MAKSDAELAARIFAIMRKKVPKAAELTGDALNALLGAKANDAEYIKDNFSQLIHDTQIKAYHLYLEHEARESGAAIRDVVMPLLPSGATADDVFSFLETRFHAIDRLCLSLSQSRRTRAGSTFETIVTTLFRKLGYPHTPQPQINGSRPDYVLPSLAHYLAYSSDCIIFTCKRTLRERWRQAITEGVTGQFFLATVDDQLSVQQIDAMKEKNVVLVVPAGLKNTAYKDRMNVVSFETFFDHYLDPAIVRWKANGTIS